MSTTSVYDITRWIIRQDLPPWSCVDEPLHLKLVSGIATMLMFTYVVPCRTYGSRGRDHQPVPIGIILESSQRCPTNMFQSLRCHMAISHRKVVSFSCVVIPLGQLKANTMTRQYSCCQCLAWSRKRLPFCIVFKDFLPAAINKPLHRYGILAMASVLVDSNGPAWHVTRSTSGQHSKPPVRIALKPYRIAFSATAYVVQALPRNVFTLGGNGDILEWEGIPFVADTANILTLFNVAFEIV